MNIEIAIGRFVAERRQLNFALLTIQKDTPFVLRFAAYAGNIEIEQVKYDILIAFLVEAGKDKKPATKAQHISRLRAFGRFLEDTGINWDEGRNPFLRLRRPKMPYRVPRAPQASDLVAALIKMRNERTIKDEYDAWRLERDWLMICTMAVLGPRISELTRLQWRDIDRQALRIIGKGDVERIIPLPIRLSEAYKNFLRIEKDRGRGQPSDYIFNAYINRIVGRANGPTRKVSTARVRDIVALLAKDVPGFETVTPHTLRHAALTAMVDVGTDIVTVARIAGHKNIQTCYNWYVAPRDKASRQAVESTPMMAALSRSR